MKSLRMAHGAATLATCVLVGLTASGDAAGAAASGDPLCEAACDLADWVCGTGTSEGIDQLTDGFIDEVDRVTWGSLEPLIAKAKAQLDAILDPFDTPSLHPVDAGADAVPLNASFMTTEEMGDELCERAREAKEEICSSDPNHETAGTLLHQMRWLLDDLEEQARPIVAVPFAVDGAG